MPASFQSVHGGAGMDAWIPLGTDDYVLAKDTYFFEVSGKLKPGVAMTTAQAELNLLNQQLKLGEKRIGRDFVSDTRLSLSPLNEVFAGTLRRPLLILLAAVAFVLLIACANVANLFLTR